MKTASVIITNELLRDMGHDVSRLDTALLHESMLWPSDVSIVSFEDIAAYDHTRVNISGDGVPGGCNGQEVWAQYSRVELSPGKFTTVFDGFKVPPDLGPPKFMRSAKTGKCFWCKRELAEHSPNDRFCPIPVQPLAE